MLFAVVQRRVVQEAAPGINEILEDVVRTHKQPGVGGGYQDNLKRESQKQNCVSGFGALWTPSGCPLLAAVDSEGIGPDRISVQRPGANTMALA